MNFILSWLTGGGFKAIAEEIADWDLRRRQAANDADRIAAETHLAHLRLQQALLVEETKYASTRWIRPAFALPVVIYWWKLIVWDTILGWGVTQYPGGHVSWFVVMIPTAYFLARAWEKR